MINIENLTISFNGTTLFRNLNFRVEKREIFTLTGESGKGKSSVFSAILGFITPETGSITVNSVLLNPGTIQSIRNSIAWLPQNLNALPNLKVSQQLDLFASFKNNHNNFKYDKFLELAKLFNLKEDIIKNNFAELSGGEKQRIGLIYALLQNKDILLLDEPTSALDDYTERIVTDFLHESCSCTILASSHSEYWMSKSNKTLRI